MARPPARRPQTLERGTEQVNLARDRTTDHGLHSTHAAVAHRAVSSLSIIIYLIIMKNTSELNVKRNKNCEKHYTNT